MTLEGIAPFSYIKTFEIHVHVNASVRVKVLDGMSFNVMAEVWKHLKDTHAFRRFLCVRIEKESCLQMICCPIYH